MATSIKLTVNGKSQTIRVDDPEMPLLYALRDDLGLHGPRFGCGLAQCGACTVHVDGKAIRSCAFPVSAAAGRKVLTLEGLGTPEQLHPLQQAFVEEQAVQCGFCINGMIMQSQGVPQLDQASDRGPDQAIARRQSLSLRHPCANCPRREARLRNHRVRRDKPC